MARIPIGEARIGAITPVGAPNLGGLRRAVASRAQGSADLAAGVSGFGDVLAQIGAQNDANADSVYTNKVLTDEIKWVAQHTDRFNQEPGAFQREARARQRELVKSARVNLSSGQALAKLEVGLTTFNTNQFVGFVDKNSKIVRQEAFQTQVQAIEDVTDFYSNLAAQEGSAGTLTDGLQSLRLLEETYRDEQNEGGVGNIVFPNGDTAIDRTKRMFELARQKIAGAALGKDALDLLGEGGDQDHARRAILNFIKNGAPDLDLSPQDRFNAATLAMSQLNMEVQARAGAMRNATIALRPEIAALTREINSGAKGEADIVAFTKKHGLTLPVGQSAALWDALARRDNEVRSIKEVGEGFDWGREIQKSFEKWDTQKIIDDGLKRGFKKATIAEGLRMWGRGQSDQLQIDESRNVLTKITEITAVEGFPDLDALEAWAAINHISPEGVLKLYTAAFKKWSNDNAVEAQETLTQLRLKVEDNPMAHNPVSIRALLKEKGLHNNLGALKQLTSNWLSARQKVLNSRQEGNYAAGKVASDNGSPTVPGIQDYLEQTERGLRTDVDGQRVVINYANMTAQEIQAARPFLRKLYGKANTMSVQQKNWLIAGLTNHDDQPMTMARIAVYSDMRGLEGKAGAMVTQLPDRVQAFYNFIIDKQLRIGAELPTALQNVLDHQASPKGDRELDVKRYLGIDDDQTITEWALDGNRLENAMERARGLGTRVLDASLGFIGVDIVGGPNNPQMFSDFELIMRNQMKVQPDVEVAMLEAGRRIMALYAPSAFSQNGQGTYERQSIELNYADARGSVHYVPFQMSEELTAFWLESGQPAPLSRDQIIDNHGEDGKNTWWVVPTRGSSKNLFKKPQYNVFYRDENGAKVMVMRGSDPYIFQPNLENTHDDKVNKFLINSFRSELAKSDTVNDFVKTIGGPQVFLNNYKRAFDLIYWLRRGNDKETIKWIKRTLPDN